MQPRWMRRATVQAEARRTTAVLAALIVGCGSLGLLQQGTLGYGGELLPPSPPPPPGAPPGAPPAPAASHDDFVKQALLFSALVSAVDPVATLSSAAACSL